MRDAAIRGVRTFLQAFLGVFVALSTSGAVGIEAAPDLEVLKRAAVAAGWAGLIALIAFVQNALEEASGHRGLK